MDTLADPASSRAVLIGPSRFVRDPALHDLPAVANNVRRLAALLGEERIWGLPDTHTTVLGHQELAVDGAAVRVLDAVSEAARHTRELLLVYYSGHGLLDEEDRLHLALPETSADKLYRAVEFEAVRRVLAAASHIPHKVLILDCCFAGMASGSRMGPASAWVPPSVPNGSFVLGAAAPTATALAVPGETYTAFTGELITLLDRGMADGEAVLRMDALAARLDDALLAKGRPRPWPIASGGGGRIALARNVAYQAPAVLLPDVLADLAAAQRRAGGAFPYQLSGAHGTRLDTVYVRQDLRRPAPGSGDSLGEDRHDERRGFAAGQRDVVKADSLGPPILLDDLLRERGHLLVIGGPGQGKTTLTLQLAMRLAADVLDHGGDAREPAGDGPGDRLLGVRVTAATLAAEEGSWEEAVVAAAARELGMALDRALPPDLLRLGGDQLHWLLMVDGVDEIADPRLRRRVVEQLAQRCGDPRLTLLVTSRDLPAEELAVLEKAGAVRHVLTPFDTAQLTAFAESWFGTDPEGRRRTAGFLAGLDQAGPRELLRVPLLATIAAILYQQNPDVPLPGNIYTLYEQYLGYLAAARAEQNARQWHDIRARMAAALDGDTTAADRLRAERAALVEHLATRAAAGEADLLAAAVAFMADRGGRQAAIRLPDWPELIASALDATGLFLHAPRLRFVHLSLAEHLAAAAVARTLPARFDSADPAWDAVVHGLIEEEDDAVAVLVHHAYRHGDAEAVLEWLERGGMHFKLVAGLLLAEGVPAKPVHTERFLETLRRGMASGAVEHESFTSAAGRIRHPGAEQLLLELAQDPQLDVEKRAMAMAALPSGGARESAVAALRAMADDPTQVAEDRLEAIEALIDLEPEDTAGVIDPLISALTDQTADEYDVRSATRMLGALSSESVARAAERLYERLADITSETDLRLRIFETLATLETDAETLAAIIRAELAATSDVRVTGRLLNTLAGLGPGYALEAIAASDELLAGYGLDASERIEIAADLAQECSDFTGEHAEAAAAVFRAVITDPLATPGAVNSASLRLADLGPDYVSEAAAALSAVAGGPGVDISVRARAAERLSGLGPRYLPQAASALRDLVVDSAGSPPGGWGVTDRWDVIGMLAELGPAYVVEAAGMLRGVFTDTSESHHARLQAMTAFIELGPEYCAEAARVLTLWVGDPASEPIDVALPAQALARAGGEHLDASVQILRAAVADTGNDAVIRLAAADTLIDLGPGHVAEAAEAIRSVLADTGATARTRRDAATTLIALGPDYAGEAAEAMRRMVADPTVGPYDRVDTAAELRALGPEYFEEAIRTLRGIMETAPDAFDRIAAARELARFSLRYVEEAVASLSALASDRAWESSDRVRAAQELTGISRRYAGRSADLLRAILVEEVIQPSKRWTIAEALAGLGPPHDADAARCLRELIRDSGVPPLLLIKAAASLAKLENGETADAQSTLHELIADPDTEPDVRAEAAKALLGTAPHRVSEAVAALRRTIADPAAKPSTRYWAADALADARRRDAADAVTIMCSGLVDPEFGPVDRRRLAGRIARRGPQPTAEAASVLLEALADPAQSVRSRIKHARTLAVLGPEQRRQAAEALLAVIDGPATEPRGRWQAAEVLAEIIPTRSNEAAAAIRTVLADPSATRFERRWAAVALARLRPAYRAEAADVIRAAIAAAAEDSEDFRWNLVALTKLGPQHAREAAGILRPQLVKAGVYAELWEGADDATGHLDIPPELEAELLRAVIASDDAEAEDRQLAAVELGWHDAEQCDQAAAYLRGVATDEDAEVWHRISAAERLAAPPFERTGEAIAILRGLVNDPAMDLRARSLAAYELARIDSDHSAEAVALMRELIAAPETEPITRGKTAILLADLDADLSAVGFDVVQDMVADPAVDLWPRCYLARLQSSAWPEHGETLARSLCLILADPRLTANHRLHAAETLAGLGPENAAEVAEALRVVTTDPAATVSDRLSAAGSLAAVGPAFLPEATRILRAMIADSDCPPYGRLFAASRLAGLDGGFPQEAVGVLQEAVDDPDLAPDDRQLAVSILTDLRDPISPEDEREQAQRPTVDTFR
ncbi:MAG: hypothetical protein HOW97_08765 [Catenulispora sp.]|nr:hypothetical protein [Catenulispora sp.]